MPMSVLLNAVLNDPRRAVVYVSCACLSMSLSAVVTKHHLCVMRIGQWQLEGRKGLRYIGGVDVSFIKGNDVDACACLVVLEYPSLQVGPSLQHQCAAHSARLCMRTLRWCS